MQCDYMTEILTIPVPAAVVQNLQWKLMMADYETTVKVIYEIEHITYNEFLH